MSLKKMLQNPFVLIGQGFVAGAILFHFTVSEPAETPAAEQPVQSASSGKNTSA